MNPGMQGTKPEAVLMAENDHVQNRIRALWRGIKRRLSQPCNDLVPKFSIRMGLCGHRG